MVLRAAQSERIFITNYILKDGRCLLLFPPHEWARIIAQLESIRPASKAISLYKTFLIGGAEELAIDPQGRITIPPLLFDFAHLMKNVVFSAEPDCLELWDEAVFERYGDDGNLRWYPSQAIPEKA
jgi:MraZ protein